VINGTVISPSSGLLNRYDGSLLLDVDCPPNSLADIML